MNGGHGTQQRVEFAEQGGIGGQMGLDEATRLLVAGGVGYEAVTSEKRPRGRVGDKDRAAGGEEQDRVHRFRAEPGNRQHLPPECRQRRPAHAVEAAAEALDQPSGEDLEPPGLDPRRSGNADDRGQLGVGERGEAVRAEQTARPQGRLRVRGIRPRRVPGEHGPHRHLVRRPNQHGGPDTAEPPLQRHVEPQQPRLRRIRRRPRNLSPAENA